MKIPLHALFEEAFGISEITDEKEFDDLVARLYKEADEWKAEHKAEYDAEMEARAIEKG